MKPVLENEILFFIQHISKERHYAFCGNLVMRLGELFYLNTIIGIILSRDIIYVSCSSLCFKCADKLT